MPIAALPAQTAAIIISSLVIHDATSVIKELIDNALDARASTITIELSANTLDVIQVRDNGTGIGVDDRQLLCKRGCTSKIRSIDDLEHLGGSYLGFRGEALASIAAVSEVVLLTTRIDGETAGCTLSFDHGGKLTGCISASHPVGSTFRVHKLFNNVPVRRQANLKSIPRILNNMKKLLQAYAFARPEVRLSLRVLKGKNDKANWTYSSDRSGSISDIIVKVFGSDLASQVKLYSLDSNESCVSEDVPRGWAIKGALASPGADSQGMMNIAEMVSIDRRPVSCDRGVIRDIMKLYRSYVRKSISQSISPVSKPFIYVELTCPPGSYDVNVEPAKDEVLFYDTHVVVQMAEALFKQAYGDVAAEDLTKPSTVHQNSREISNERGFDVLLARRPTIPKNCIRNPDQTIPSLCETLPDARSDLDPPHILKYGNLLNNEVDGARNIQHHEAVSGRTMYGPEDHGLSDEGSDNGEINMHRQHSPEEDEENDSHPTNGLNPWSLAKMNVRITPQRLSRGRTTQASSQGQMLTPGTGPNISPRLVRQPASPFPVGPTAAHDVLPTPETSPVMPALYQNPGPPMRRRARVNAGSESEGDLDSPQEPILFSVAAQPSLLDHWVQAINTKQDSALQSDGFPSVQTSSPVAGVINRPRHTPVMPSGLKPSSSLVQTNAHRQFKIPSRVTLPKSTSSVDTHVQHHGGKQPPQSGLALPHSYGNLAEASGRELDEILEFERRKKQAVTQHKLQVARHGHQGTMLPAAIRIMPQPTTTKLTGSGNERRSDEESSNGFDMTSQADFATRFGKSFTQTAHPVQPASPAHNDPLEVTKTNDDPPALPPSDPRVYLKRHNQFRHDSSTLSKTGLKIRRVKTMNLPFESLLPGTETLYLKTEISLDHLELQFQNSSNIDDPYIRTGRNEFMKWSSSTSIPPSEIDTWENKLTSLIKSKYRYHIPTTKSEVTDTVSRFGIDTTRPESRDLEDDMTNPHKRDGINTDRVAIIPEFKIDLTRALKAHVDACCQN